MVETYKPLYNVEFYKLLVGFIAFMGRDKWQVSERATVTDPSII
ncbi:hypothetical protein XNC1_1696 [Xenorhabdus nematophila ATCC 19061]|uniref:Uncharacterized protein n=1 Tax=Xenorhabdus nematophila (strain ATCC 19061 / DSM 3370 / CCUG 14189 / LMG 1036 / NCIMB 9965 / AN6) TaxID=406817 RepID=D3VCA3_XENNA|nr:hypothetical protein XNC1_1696 [Xenorhabdus nematophila ATCC 19061]